VNYVGDIRVHAQGVGFGRDEIWFTILGGILPAVGEHTRGKLVVSLYRVVLVLVALFFLYIVYL
jgi:hypothetical protein